MMSRQKDKKRQKEKNTKRHKDKKSKRQKDKKVKKSKRQKDWHTTATIGKLCIHMKPYLQVQKHSLAIVPVGHLRERDEGARGNLIQRKL